MRRHSMLGIALAALSVFAPGKAEAAVRSYRIEVPDGAESSFEIEIRAEHPGTILVAAEWAGPRILSFRLEGPEGSPVRERRSGPSPQRLQAVVTEEILAGGGPFRLAIRAPSGRGAAEGTVTVEIPDAPEIVAERERAAQPPPPPPPPPDPWTLPAKSPAGATDEVARVYATAERFRALALDGRGAFAFDACAYRKDLLRRLAEWRDAASADASPLSDSSGRYFRRLAAIGEEVETLRTTTDPLLAGPAPTDPLRRKAWVQVRQERIRPLERELDALVETLRGGHAPDLEEEAWLPRLLACLTACERHFDRRALEEESDASRAELAGAQWDSILAALEALDAVAALPAPAPGTLP